MTQGYPDYRHNAEARRLFVQQCLTVDALGGDLLLCQVDTDKPDLRILDAGTANGQFLYSLLQEGLLKHPSTVQLIGTDIKPFKDTLGLPANIQISVQDIMKDWPMQWKGTFDLVHMRHTLANSGTFDGAVKAVRRLIELSKPSHGGFIQIVDGHIDGGDINEKNDLASAQVFKTIHAGLTHLGLDPSLGRSAYQILSAAAMQEGGQTMLKNVGSRVGESTCGKGAPTIELEEMGYEQLRGLHDASMMLLKMIPDEKKPMRFDTLESLLPELLREAQEVGVKMTWYAAWGERT